MSVVIYDGGWQRSDGKAETEDDQLATGWSNGQPDHYVDEHQAKKSS